MQTHTHTKNDENREFPGGSVARTRCCQCRGLGSTPVQELDPTCCNRDPACCTAK